MATGARKIDIRKEIELATKQISKPIPADSSISLTFPAGTPSGTEAYIVITPSLPYTHFAIRYFKLTTPLEAVGNVIVPPKDDPVTDPADGMKLLADDQAENVADNVIDAGDYDQWFILCDKFWLYGRTIADTTDNRVLTVKVGGKEVKV